VIALALVAAVLVGDKVALRAQPDRTSSQQATLWKGDWVEVRGNKRGWLQVYDHRHDRPGWIIQANARVVEVDEAHAPALRAIVDFVRDTPGSESLGIAYAALYLKAAPAVDGSVWASIGVMAQRLALRVSTAANDATASEQLAVAQSWGLKFDSVDDRVCYDGDAFAQVLAGKPAPADAAAAVLGLTDPACIPALLGVSERQVLDATRAALIERVDPTTVPGPLGNELRLRRADIQARLAWSTARHGDLAAAATAAEAAVSAFARVDKAELADDDRGVYDATALVVAASRPASEVAAADAGKDRLALDVAAGEPGQTCVAVANARQCTHGQVWAGSFRVAPDRAAAAVAVEPLPGWRELWLFRKGDDGKWMVDVLPPTTDGVDLGYVELAGWSPDGKRAIVVREGRSDGAVHRSFEVVAMGTLAVERQAGSLGGLGAAKAWAAQPWRARTVALR